jgi:hypothetical protein
MPANDRPDVFAIFPTWWGVLPVWFSREVIARFPVEGNVICGGYEDVIYKADWALLNTGDSPRAPKGGRIVDTLDVADLVSEAHHHYVFPAPSGGWTDMKILPDPAEPRADLFDGGRRFAPGVPEKFSLYALTLHSDAWFVIRTVQTQKARIVAKLGGNVAFTFDLEPSDGWTETSIKLAPSLVTDRMDVELVSEGPADLVDFHVWLVQ